MDYIEIFNKYLSEIDILSDEHEKVYDWIKILSEEGYKNNDYANEILSNLGGLKIRGKGSTSKNYVEIYFNPVYYAGGEYDRMNIYNKVADDILFPIGGLYDYTIYVGKNGKYYIADWKNLYECGNSINSFMKNIFLDNPQLIELYNNE
ncbi:MAG: SUKH-3 domain-containing protein [Methanobrevibacter sp.]|uniref:SUKH-3 domain-containing protein n=1 Tax=Methanobrevibacter sp. TaxID=66852 RepID=UPI0025CED054|nr:SUKH-3 domain-containing protein [Methanobrevibacter sp.]MBQ8018452.1 SUKH-3 domain-containing protein [Methanobrevibacter sp.]